MIEGTLDNLLRSLSMQSAELLKETGVEPLIAVVLSTKGGFVSGFLISATPFIELYKQGPYAKITSSDNYLDSNNLEFVHLKNTQFSTLGSIPSPHDFGILWRGKLDEIDGFSLLPLPTPPTT